MAGIFFSYFFPVGKESICSPQKTGNVKFFVFGTGGGLAYYRILGKLNKNGKIFEKEKRK